MRLKPCQAMGLGAHQKLGWGGGEKSITTLHYSLSQCIEDLTSDKDSDPEQSLRGGSGMPEVVSSSAARTAAHREPGLPQRGSTELLIRGLDLHLKMALPRCFEL